MSPTIDLEFLEAKSTYVEDTDDDPNIVRKIVPASLPPTRASKSHYHHEQTVEWKEKLDMYPIPENIQKRAPLPLSCFPFDFMVIIVIDEADRYTKFNPWYFLFLKHRCFVIPLTLGIRARSIVGATMISFGSKRLKWPSGFANTIARR